MTRRPTQLLVLAIAALTATIAIPTADALILTGNKWPSGRVNVCFRSDAASVPDFAHRANTVKDTVENNWGRVANLRFEGWGVCPGPAKSEPQETIVIHWRGQDPTDSSLEGIGMSIVGFLTGKSTGMYLDPKPAEKFRALTLHEFGHALGFWHEEDHPSNPTPNRAGCLPGKAATGATVLTPFDTSSIMHSRCDGGVLSPLDVVGVQNAYGRKVSGAVVGPNNRCLDIPDSSWIYEVKLQVYNCNGTRAQRWEWWLGKLRATLHPDPGIYRCADAGDVVSPTATVLKSQKCYAGSPLPGQRFSFANVEIRGMGEKCVDNRGMVMITNVQLGDCNGGAGQAWTIEPDGVVRAGSSGNCLDVPYSSFVSGQTLWLYACNGTAAQRFTFTAFGELRIGGLCVGSGPLSASPGPLRLESCKPEGFDKRGQQWHLRGPIRGLGNRFLDVQGGVAIDRAKALLSPRTTPPRSAEGEAISVLTRWDYYF